MSSVSIENSKSSSWDNSNSKPNLFIRGEEKWLHSELQKKLQDKMILKLDLSDCNLDKIFDVVNFFGPIVNCFGSRVVKNMMFKDLQKNYQGAVNTTIKELKIKLYDKPEDNEYYLKCMFCSFVGLKKLILLNPIFNSSNDDDNSSNVYSISNTDTENPITALLSSQKFDFEAAYYLNGYPVVQYIKI